MNHGRFSLGLSPMPRLMLLIADIISSLLKALPQKGHVFWQGS